MLESFAVDWRAAVSEVDRLNCIAASGADCDAAIDRLFAIEGAILDGVPSKVSDVAAQLGVILRLARVELSVDELEGAWAWVERLANMIAERPSA